MTTFFPPWHHPIDPKEWFSTRITGSAVALLWLVLLPAGATPQRQPRDPWVRARHLLVAEAIEAEGITNPAVLESMRTVPRHEFVTPKLRAQAYFDQSLPIGSKQTISPPYVVAYMTQALDPQPEDRILEIGTGSGYQAAVLAEIVRDVYTIEIVPELARSAARRLERLNYTNAHVREGDGYAGWPEQAPFDRIIVTCSPESVPRPLIDQLRNGGTMIVPIGKRYQQTFHLFHKSAGKLEQKKLISTLFVPMTGHSEELRQLLPDADQPAIVNGGFDTDVNDDGKADGWHYQRRSKLMEDSPVDGMRYLRLEAEENGQNAQALQGMAINGRRLGLLDFSAWVQAANIRPGSRGEQSAMMIHFYNAQRSEVATEVVMRFRGTWSWEKMRRRIRIPRAAREMILRIGLNGATGRLDVDDFAMVAIPR